MPSKAPKPLSLVEILTLDNTRLREQLLDVEDRWQFYVDDLIAGMTEEFAEEKALLIAEHDAYIEQIINAVPTPRHAGRRTKLAIRSDLKTADEF